MKHRKYESAENSLQYEFVEIRSVHRRCTNLNVRLWLIVDVDRLFIGTQKKKSGLHSVPKALTSTLTSLAQARTVISPGSIKQSTDSSYARSLRPHTL